MAQSDIEWTDVTWNPVSGCDLVSPGCTNCYAMRMAGRLEAMGSAKYAGTTRRSGRRAVWTSLVRTHDSALAVPSQWRTGKRVFVNSMSDLFHEEVPIEFIRDVWRVMAENPHHSFQILTKRPERMRDVLSSAAIPCLDNVWLGTSIETRNYLFRLRALRDTPAAIRYVSFEPLLGPLGRFSLRCIDWAIVGGESGPGAREIRKAWVDSIKATCEQSGTAFFFKQWGGSNKKKNGRRLDGRTWDDYPDTTSVQSSTFHA